MELDAVGELPLGVCHLDDQKFAGSKMIGPELLAFYAEMMLKYYRSIPGRSEEWFGCIRRTINLALNDKRRGVICLRAQEAYCGNYA